METDLYFELHNHFNSLPRFCFPFEKKTISLNGIYILFEKGESVNKLDRIVRIGSHDADNRLIKRLGNHISGKQRTSALRKHIGYCLLTMKNDPYINNWKLPFKKIIDKERNKEFVNLQYEMYYESEISAHIISNLSFCVIPNVVDRLKRDRFEEGLIALLAKSDKRISSERWLGNIHPNKTISNGKLWNIEYMNGNPLTKKEFDNIINITSS